LIKSKGLDLMRLFGFFHHLIYLVSHNTMQKTEEDFWQNYDLCEL
jgi:hypothetical protein